jgi:carboxymethylenebutenolidase
MRRTLVLASTLLAACTIQRTTRSGAAVADEHLSHMSAADMAVPASHRGPLVASQQGTAGLPASNIAAPARVVASQQGTAGLPASNTAAPARLAASPRHGEWVKFPAEPGSSDSIMAWIVHPSTSRRAPVVVVVHEIFGLSTWVRGVADQVAAEGFVAIAPDFLSRVRGGPSSAELSGDTARRLIQGVSTTERNRIIAAAASYAMMQPSATQRYGVIGYCWGGTTTFAHAVNGGVKGFGGGVAFYGLPYTTGGQQATATTAAVPASLNTDSLQKITAPVMLLNGSKDTRIAGLMPQLDSVMTAMGKSYTGVNYEGAVHGFLRAQNDPRSPQRDETEEAANLAATKDGWPRTVAFLKKNLGVN